MDYMLYMSYFSNTGCSIPDPQVWLWQASHLQCNKFRCSLSSIGHCWPTHISQISNTFLINGQIAVFNARTAVLKWHSNVRFWQWGTFLNDDKRMYKKDDKEVTEEMGLLIFLEVHFNVSTTQCHSVFHCVRSWLQGMKTIWFSLIKICKHDILKWVDENSHLSLFFVEHVILLVEQSHTPFFHLVQECDRL